MQKIVTVIGTRPQFIKSAPVSKALQAAGLTEILVETGQHYDDTLRAIFFQDLHLTLPHYNLAVGSGSHAYQTGEGMMRLEPILLAEQPDLVLVYGDTSATLVGALTAAKLGIPVAHIEAGLRSFNRQMPEEINRVMVDHLSSWLFTPTTIASDNLRQEGIKQGLYQVGDVMLDAVLQYEQLAQSALQDWLFEHNLEAGKYYLLTLHRAETAHQKAAVQSVLDFLDQQDRPVLFPVHPRMSWVLSQSKQYKNIRCCSPLGYVDMLCAVLGASTVLTDSGGLQKEAAILERPCVTLRTETEWIETIESGWNQLVGLSVSALEAALKSVATPAHSLRSCYGDGQASHRIAQVLAETPGATTGAEPVYQPTVTILPHPC